MLATKIANPSKDFKRMKKSFSVETRSKAL